MYAASPEGALQRISKPVHGTSGPEKAGEHGDVLYFPGTHQSFQKRPWSRYRNQEPRNHSRPPTSRQQLGNWTLRGTIETDKNPWKHVAVLVQKRLQMHRDLGAGKLGLHMLLSTAHGTTLTTVRFERVRYSEQPTPSQSLHRMCSQPLRTHRSTRAGDVYMRTYIRTRFYADTAGVLP